MKHMQEIKKQERKKCICNPASTHPRQKKKNLTFISVLPYVLVVYWHFLQFPYCIKLNIT